MTNNDLVFHYGYRERIMTITALSSVQQFFANRSSPDVMIPVSLGILSLGDIVVGNNVVLRQYSLVDSVAAREYCRLNATTERKR